MACTVVLERLLENLEGGVAAARAWKTLLLLPRMLLQRSEVTGKAGKLVFQERYRQFVQGEWSELLEAARGAANKKTVRKELNEEEEQQKVLREAVRLVRLGELSKARQALLAAKLAPGTQETLDKLNNPEKRPPRALVPLSEEVLNTQPDTPVRLNKGLFLNKFVQHRGAPQQRSQAGETNTGRSCSTTKAQQTYCT